MDGRLKPELLLFSALGCDGSCSPEEEISQPDSFSKAADAKSNDQ